MQLHRTLIGLAALVPFLALTSAEVEQFEIFPGQATWDSSIELPGMSSKAATRGRTDGEPTTAEGHCCGMKGLGGATIEVMCHPETVAMGKPFTVNVKYTSDIKRPVDVHVDVLNAHTKAFYAGKWEEFDTQAGEVSLTIQMPSWGVEEPFLWKVFLTPRGEPFPNMLAETGFVARKCSCGIMGEEEPLGRKCAWSRLLSARARPE